MSSMNHVMLMGNLTRDPEIRTLPGGQVVAELGLAINESYKDKDGKPVEKTCFADIVVWGKQAQACRQYLKKGASALVEGKLQYEQWTTEGGEKRSKLRIKAHRVQFLGRAASETKTSPPPPNRETEEFEPIPF